MKNIVFNRKPIVSILIVMLVMCALPSISYGASDDISVVASTASPLTEATLDESVVTLTLSGGAYERSGSTIRDAVEVSGIDGVTVGTFGIDRESDTEITVELEFDGNMDTDATLTFTVGADALAEYSGSPLTAQIPVTAVTESVVASTASPLTEATLDESVVTLTLSGGAYERSGFTIRDAVEVSGIDGVTVGTFGIDRESDTEITVELEFDGNIDTDATLTFTVGADALAGYNGPVLTAQIPVSATRSVIASTSAPLTEATLDESVVTLSLSGGAYEQAGSDIRGAVAVSGIDGVTFGVERVSDTEITVELEFNGDIDTDATLTFTVGADALAGYNGPVLTAQIPVSATRSVIASTSAPLTEATLDESVVTLSLSGGAYEQAGSDIRGAVAVSGIDGVTFGVERVSDTEITVELEFNGTDFDTDAALTFTVGADALAGYNGSPLTTQIPVAAIAEAVVASTASPLTEATLDESVVTLTLSGGAYEQAGSDIRGAVAVSGIDGVTFGVERVSDTEITVELEFNGTDFDTDAALTFTVGADALAGYNGSPLTTQIPVAAIAEAVVASTASPLTEATLDESVVTLTLSGRTYARIGDIRDAVEVAGIEGVTVETFNVERASDTEVTVELEFNGDIDTDATLTFTVGADALAGYNGPVLTAQIPVSATRSVIASTSAPLTEATLDESVVTLTLSGGTYARIGDIRDAVEVAGIEGVTVETFNVERASDTEITVELEFNGDIDTDATLTFTVGADALAGYNGPVLTAQIPVSATRSVIASTSAPLTEATLDESVVTLSLSGGAYEQAGSDIRGAVAVSGIDGVTFGVERVSDTEITVELEFNGTDFDTDATLTFTVGADALAGYNGSPLTTQIPVAAIAEAVVASTVAPLTEATLDESVVTLSLSGGAYEQAGSDIRGAVAVSGIDGVTFGVERVSDTEITVKLEFDGTDFDTLIRLTFTVGADAIAGYNGPSLTTQILIAQALTLEGNMPSPVTSMAFSPDGALLATGGGTNYYTVTLWDVATRESIATLERRGHRGEVTSVAFSPDGTLLASGSRGKMVTLWDVATRENIATLEGHRFEVTSVAFSPDGTLLASGGRGLLELDGSGEIKLWDVATRENIATLEGHRFEVTSVAFSPDGTLLAAGGIRVFDGEIKLWDVATRESIATLEGHTQEVTSVAFSPDGTLLASASQYRRIKLWDVEKRESIATLEGHMGHRGEVTSVAFSPDGTLLASGGGVFDNTVRLWDVEKRESIATLKGHNGVTSVAFSPDGTLLLASGGRAFDKMVRLWDVAAVIEVAIEQAGDTNVATLEGHKNAVTSVAFSPDGTILASASDDQTIRLWDVGTPTNSAIVFGNEVGSGGLGFTSVAFSPDGTLLAAGSEDNTFSLWDMVKKERIATVFGDGRGEVTSVAFSPDGTILATARDNNRVELWDT